MEYFILAIITAGIWAHAIYSLKHVNRLEVAHSYYKYAILSSYIVVILLALAHLAKVGN
jgi:hypothetical protein